ncbi:MAG: hypothetical protein HOL90_01145 [Candidatus Nitrosopelagicus sp.]|jgi:hypothetical protein|nr:hypothetical protein [Candidatus Nitrosopelagicus sp.]|tara:strand:- start:100 stop:309 length:210 start_codon:yes stop_codon:yes gene_type:complete
MAGQISETIKKKLKEILNDPQGESDEYKIAIELLEKTEKNDKLTKASQVKKEFQLLADQYFSYKENNDE